jgi:F-type H+-transporting ATPase subunit b
METYIVGLALIIFLGLVWWKGRHAIVASLDKKIGQIRADIDEAGRLREEAERLFAENSKLAEGAEDESVAIIAQAKGEADRSQTDAVTAFAALAGRRREQAEAKINQAEAEAVRAVRIEATVVALAAARQVIADVVTGDQANALLDEAIEELPNRLNI